MPEPELPLAWGRLDLNQRPFGPQPRMGIENELRWGEDPRGGIGSAGVPTILTRLTPLARI